MTIFLLQLLLAASLGAVRAEPILGRSDILSCLSTRNVPQALPGSTQFNFETKPFNLRLPFTPVAVAMPTTIPQVQEAVKCGVRHKVKVTAKAGGHSYASHGLGGENGHLMINLKYFNNVTLDTNTNIATIGPGARLGNIAQALYNQGKRAISHGVCPAVGMGGHVLHGGYGYSSHTRGLTLDWLVEAKVVLANGLLVTASRTQNSELFWAIKGAGSSFGIIVSMKFNTFPAPENITVFTYVYFGMDKTRARTAIQTLQDYGSSIRFPKELNLRMFIPPPVYNATLFTGAYYGSEASFPAAMEPLFTAIGAPDNTTEAVVGWIDSLLTFASEPLTTPLDYDAHDNFFCKSLMTTSISPAAIEKFVDYWYTEGYVAPRLWYVNIDLHGGPTSGITNVKGEAGGSYPHRNAVLKFQLMDIETSGGPYPPDGTYFINGFVDTITSTTPRNHWGMYVNYADPTLPDNLYGSYYWKQNYPRLRMVKTIYDPFDVFHNPQSVKPF